MEPTILQGEKFAVKIEPFEPRRGSLIMFTHEDLLLIKRVIGVGGDVVEGRDFQVFVNGQFLNEPYAEHIGKRPPDIKTMESFGPIKVPEGKLFVAGDNRDYSLDSRYPGFGLIALTDIRGTPVKIVESSDPRREGKPLR